MAKFGGIAACVAIMAAGGVGAQAKTGPTFVVDAIFDGSSVDGWKQGGGASWESRGGEIAGKATQGGGWLLLEKPIENVGLYTEMKCTGSCDAGVILRAEKTPEGGLRGIYVSLSDTEQEAYSLTLDAQGREVSRTKLAEGISDGGLQSNATGASQPGLSEYSRSRLRYPLPVGVKLPDIEEPAGAYIPGSWNELNLIAYGDTLLPIVNGGNVGAAIARRIISEEQGGYGAIALYVRGGDAAQFRNIGYRDLSIRAIERETLSPNFRAQKLENYFFSWSANVADVNRDGHPDILAGPYYYLGPDFSKAHEIYAPVAYNPTTDYPLAADHSLAQDFNGDGWPDLLMMVGNSGWAKAFLYTNPKGESRHWDKKFVMLTGNEEAILKDIDGDGQLEVIHSAEDALAYSKPDLANPDGKWITTIISDKGPWGEYITHGMGVGDINGDGLMDYINPYGWWEQPAKGVAKAKWTYHPYAFARAGASQGGAGGAEMGVYDVNGDGLNDVVTPLEGHGWGLAWYEQKRDGKGTISFTQHMIMDNFLTKNAGDVTFTEPHAAVYADMDGDGIPDLVVGKRHMSHLFRFYDPDFNGPPVLYVYRTVRNPSAPGGAEFVPELIHNASGVGAHFSANDLNGDGKPDLATSGPAGTFVFFNREAKGQTK